MMLEPTTRFRQSEHAKGWPDVVDSARFQAAASAALLQMQMNLSTPPDMGTAASFHFRMEGAKQFLQVLMSLTEPKIERPQPSSLNLNHT